MGSVWRSRLCLGRAARCCVLALSASALLAVALSLRQLRALDRHRRLSWLLQRRLGLCLVDLLLLRLALDIVDVAVLVLRLGIHAGRSVCVRSGGDGRGDGVLQMRRPGAWCGYRCGGGRAAVFQVPTAKAKMALTQPPGRGAAHARPA